MKTDELIEQLSADAAPVRRSSVERRIALGVIAGATVSLLVLLAFLGLRADLMEAMHRAFFWTRIAYSGSLAVVGLYLTDRLARPGRGAGPVWLVGAPIALLAIVAAAELLGAPRSRWLDMWLGSSWKACSGLVLMLAVPLFLGVAWAFRRFAPTQLRAAGAAAGLTAGAISATIFGLHCPEVTAIFVLSWYTLGMALAALLGWLVGPRILRW